MPQVINQQVWYSEEEQDFARNHVYHILITTTDETLREDISWHFDEAVETYLHHYFRTPPTLYTPAIFTPPSSPIPFIAKL
jgi:hypothetical protein